MPWVVVEDEPKKEGWGADILKRAVPSAAADAAGQFGDLNALFEGLDKGAARLISKTGIISPKQAEDYGRYIDEGAAKQGRFRAKTSADYAKGADIKAPETKQGQYARTLLGFAPAAASPGNAVSRAAQVVIPAVVSETAGQVTKGTKMEAPARMAAAILAGGGTAAAGNSASRGGQVGRMLREDTRNVTPQQIAQARALMENSPVRLSGAEAVQQVTNSGSNLGTRQRVVEGTPAGQRIFAPEMADRPQQVDAAARQVFDRIAPQTQSPSELALRVQQGANTAIGDARRDVNALATPHYDALQGQMIPDAEFQALRNDPSYVAAQDQLRRSPELNYGVQGAPDNDLSVVNEVLKQLDAMAQEAAPAAGTVGNSNQLAARRGEARTLADQIASNASPDWRAARDIVAAGHEQILDPMQNGPLGQIGRSSDIRAQTSAVYPNQPPEGMANDTAQTLQALGPQGADLTRQHLANTFNESTQNLQGGLNQYGGAKFAATVAGNPEQRAVLEAGVQTSAPQAADDLALMLQSFEATGKRQPPGSQTAYNTEALKDLGNAGTIGQVLETGLNPPGTFRRLGDKFKEFQTSRNAEGLANALLADPARFEQILTQARQPGQNPGIAAALAALLADQSTPNQ